jgi:hypothetical protein
MKSNNLLVLLQDYKQGRLYIPPPHGGEGETITVENQKIAPEDQQLKEKIFVDYLQNLIHDNNRWLAVLYGVLIALIVFLAVILWRKQDNQVYFFTLLTGQGLSLLFCVNRLSYFYQNKRSSEILLYLYQTANTPQEKEKVVNEIIEFLKSKKSNSASPS